MGPQGFVLTTKMRKPNTTTGLQAARSPTPFKAVWVFVQQQQETQLVGV